MLVLQVCITHTVLTVWGLEHMIAISLFAGEQAGDSLLSALLTFHAPAMLCYPTTDLTEGKSEPHGALDRCHMYERAAGEDTENDRRRGKNPGLRKRGARGMCHCRD
jgi:hypothetical protein